MTKIMELSLIGGLIAMVTTAIGSFIFLILKENISTHSKLKQFNISADLTLGVMLSAVAFSLIGPQVIQNLDNYNYLNNLIAGFGIGLIFIGFLNKRIKASSYGNNNSKLLLALTLAIHNFPEGMASGAGLAGLNLTESVPLLTAIGVQNIAEGLLFVICLKALGLSTWASILGGLGSGFIEFLGAILAGYALNQTVIALPFSLALAGGAMLMSVLIELWESSQTNRSLNRKEFIIGILLVPLIQIVSYIRL